MQRSVRLAPVAIALGLVALIGAPLMADGPTVTTGRAIYHDVSPPLSEMAIPAGPQTGLSKEIPIMARPGTRPDLAQAPDGALQADDRPIPGASPTPPVGLNWEGLSDDDNSAVVGFRIVPPDTNGDIGFDHLGNKRYMQYINLIWALWDADTGALLSGPNIGNSFWTGFGGNCQTNNDGDPVVLYDDDAGRWFVSQFSINQGIQCVALSQTSDPLGTYDRWAFTITPGGANDYPKLGVWYDQGDQSAYTFTSRDFGGAGGAFSNAAGVMERDVMLAGGVAPQFIKFSNPCVGNDCVEGQLPPHMAADPPPANTCPTFFTIVDEQFDDSPHLTDGVRQHTLCVDWNTLGNSTYSENAFAGGANFDRGLGNGFSDCISPVPAPGEVLDCLAIFTMFRAQYRWHGSHASVVLNTTVDAGASRAGIHWNEVRSTDGDTGWSIFQEGTYAPADGEDRWMGSIAMDGDGNIALGYSRVSDSVMPSVSYTTRMASSPLGVMDGGEEDCHIGTGVQTASANRWGDYSAMSIDPDDDCTFWYTQEYYETTGSFDFTSRICSFKLADCGDGGGGIPCEDIDRFQARCRPGGLVQYRVIMTDTSHNGETITFQIDGANDDTRTIFGTGRAQGSQAGFALGSHTVSVTDPAGCVADRVVTCQ